MLVPCYGIGYTDGKGRRYARALCRKRAGKEGFMPHHIIRERCVGCGHCAAVCPTQAVSCRSGETIFCIDPALCTDCGQCSGVCPQQAIQLRLFACIESRDPG